MEMRLGLPWPMWVKVATLVGRARVTELPVKVSVYAPAREIASELVHTGLTAMTMGATNELFINTCFNYPTLGEMYKYATYDAMGKKAKLEKEAAQGDLKE